MQVGQERFSICRYFGAGYCNYCTKSCDEVSSEACLDKQQNDLTSWRLFNIEGLRITKWWASIHVHPHGFWVTTLLNLRRQWDLWSTVVAPWPYICMIDHDIPCINGTIPKLKKQRFFAMLHLWRPCILAPAGGRRRSWFPAHVTTIPEAIVRISAPPFPSTMPLWIQTA